MLSQSSEHLNDRGHFDRRKVLQFCFGGTAALGLSRPGAAISAPPDDESNHELEKARARLKQVTQRPLEVVRSEHFEAIGDASVAFMKLTLADCEQIAVDFIEHYREKGFDLKMPARRLVVGTLFDERPFRKLKRGTPPSTIGMYLTDDNVLFVFDFRNVPTASRAGHANLGVLAHELCHLLSYNTGLLNLHGDVPRSITEGIGMYAENRPTEGTGHFGRLNLLRLDSIAHLQRRQKWTPVRDLLVDDKAAFEGPEAKFALSYCESWLLVYHLMTSPVRLPQFRAYLRTIYARTDKNRRFDDAETHFGSLDRLDEELRRTAMQLDRNRSTKQ